MAMALETSYRSVRPPVQNPLEACYGFPPPPSALRQSAAASSTNFQPQNPPSPSPTPSTTTPPATPLSPRNQYLMQDGTSTEPQRIECGSNLADYLAKNPGMKRLYNNHGSIKRPACVSCNESRKKCDLERPCARCVKYKLPCIERPPRAKKRKVEHDVPLKPPPQHYPPPANLVPYGLPSPVSEPQSETRVGTPIELDNGPMFVTHTSEEWPIRTLCCTPSSPPGCSEVGTYGERAVCHFDADTPDHQNVTDLDLPLDLLDIPLPIGSYLQGISATLSCAPVFGLESNDSMLKEKVLKELERDLSMDVADLDVSGASNLLWSANGMANEMATGSEGMKFQLQGIDVGASTSYMPTDQEIKDILSWKGLDLEMIDAQFDGVPDLRTHVDVSGADFSSGVGTLDWDDDWNIG